MAVRTFVVTGDIRRLVLHGGCRDRATEMRRHYTGFASHEASALTTSARTLTACPERSFA